MAGVTKRYLLTGGVIITVLMAAVSLGRYAHGRGEAASVIDSKVKGPENAPIKIVLFSDLQCSACAFVRAPLEKLIQEFPNEIQVTYRHYPLEKIHIWSIEASLFAECAGQQGKFWEYHDRLFDEQRTWSTPQRPTQQFWNYAVDLGLNMKELEACIVNPGTLDQVKADKASGDAKQVGATPTIFINEQRLVGGRQLQEQGREIILAELKKAGIRVPDKEENTVSNEEIKP